MKHSKTVQRSRAGFSWLAYGFLSLSMLVIAAVSATVGQDKEQSSVAMGGGMGMGMDMTALRPELTEFKRDRTSVQTYLNSVIVDTLNPRGRGGMSRRMMAPQRFQYAVEMHVDDQPLENLIRFDVTRTETNFGRGMSKEKEKTDPIVAGSGVLLVDTATVYMDVLTEEGKSKLVRLNRQHFVDIQNFKEPTKIEAREQLAKSSE